jgi:hypothetical protein
MIGIVNLRDERRNFRGLLELAAPDEQSLLKGADFVGDLTLIIRTQREDKNKHRLNI